MDQNQAQLIQPAAVNIANEQLDAVCDANPALYPLGLELVVCVPGALEPIGKIHVPSGRAVALLPLGMSAHLRAAVGKAIEEAQKQAAGQGKVVAPGFRR